MSTAVQLALQCCRSAGRASLQNCESRSVCLPTVASFRPHQHAGMHTAPYASLRHTPARRKEQYDICISKLTSTTPARQPPRHKCGICSNFIPIGTHNSLVNRLCWVKNWVWLSKVLRMCQWVRNPDVAPTPVESIGSGPAPIQYAMSQSQQIFPNQNKNIQIKISVAQNSYRCQPPCITLQFFHW